MLGKASRSVSGVGGSGVFDGLVQRVKSTSGMSAVVNIGYCPSFALLKISGFQLAELALVVCP